MDYIDDRAVFDTCINGIQAVAKFRLYPVAENKPAEQKRKSRPDGTGKGDQQQTPPEAEQCCAKQGHDCGTRQR